MNNVLISLPCVSIYQITSFWQQLHTSKSLNYETICLLQDLHFDKLLVHPMSGAILILEQACQLAPNKQLMII